MKKVVMSCTHCGSTEVYRDAWAEWDVESQSWVLQDVFDYAYCCRCDGETRIEMKEIDDEKVQG